MTVEIYTIDFCPICSRAEDSLKKSLTKEFGSSVLIKNINIDEKDNEKEYIEFIDSIQGFAANDGNVFPLIKIDDLFTIVGYDYYFDEEIINDIIRLNKGSHLGKRLERCRYLRG